MADPGEVKPVGGPLQTLRLEEIKSDSEEDKWSKREQRIKEEESGDFEVQSGQLTQPSGPENEVKPEDTAVTPVKAPVVWSPLTVKAAVSRLSGVQHAQSTKTSPSAPAVIKQEEGSDLLPKVAIAWSQLTVQTAVNRLSVMQHLQPAQPTLHGAPTLVHLRPADDALRPTIPPKQSRQTQTVIPPEAPPVMEKSEIKVIQTGRYHRSKVLEGPWNRVGNNLVRGRFKCLPKDIMKVPGFKDIMIAEVLKVLDNECETLTSLTFNSMLRENDPVALKDFSWDKVMTEWKTAAPTFLKFLRHASKVFEKSSADQKYTPKDWSLPMAMGGALLLRARSPFMCAPMYINSMILQQGGTGKRCIDQLNRVGVCMSHSRMQVRLKKVGKRRGRKRAKRKDPGETEEMDTKTDDLNEKTEGSAYEEGGSDVPEITYIVS